ncbi:MAG TPA: cytochrome c biogenesis protein CcsA [Saprospiraceae bacterium]|nr:cytochrome c biogenesis protein CcsA [Saprospiraceae bacterium]
MWWKILSVVLIVYTLIAGLLVPLKPGITHVYPETTQTGHELRLTLYGYNSFYTQSPAEQIRVWLQLDENQAVQGLNVKTLDDTTLEASFSIPRTLPDAKRSAYLNAIIDHPTDGVSLLPGAVLVNLNDTMRVTGPDRMWYAHPVKELHIKSDFSFPYRNVIYESIRNTYYHVPMWFVLMFLFAASAWQGVRFLQHTNTPAGRGKNGYSKLEYDRRAVAYTETGLLFGIMGLVTGMLWANYAWGAPWSNDIKQLTTAVALLIYVAYFILRGSFDEPEKGARLAAVYNIFAFASLIPLLYIVPRMFASLHPGATGNPAFGSQDLDNTMRMVFYPSIIGWALLGYWITQLRFRYQRLRDRAEGIETA